MDISFTEEQEKWKREVTEFLEKEMTLEFLEEIERSDYATSAVSLPFSRKLAAKGWVGLALPKEYGGQGRSYIDQAILAEQMGYFLAPQGGHTGVNMLGAALFHNGTEEQKKKWLPRIARQEIVSAQVWTEPEAGTDLASLRTRAVPDGDDYLISGDKSFSSLAHHADHLFVATRTDPDAPKHRGISMFVVDAKSPGITILPMWSMNHGRVSQLFFDNVRVPAENMVGKKNNGWTVLRTSLGVHRSGVDVVAYKKRIFDEMLAYAKKTKRGGKLLIEDPIIRYRFAEWSIYLGVARLLAWRVIWMKTRGEAPGMETTIQSLFDRISEHAFFNFTMQILGLFGQLRQESKHAVFMGLIERRFQKASCVTGAGAVPAISRDTISIRGLGMPRVKVVVG
jgi:alkylation response protein AidB-like acyl-CoA dehydrogenase